MRGLWRLAWEFLREVFELDSRLFRTLKFLFLKPGHLSSEFSDNRRAAYTSPVRLYIFSSFLFFFVLSVATRGPLARLGQSDADQPGAQSEPAAAIGAADPDQQDQQSGTADREEEATDQGGDPALPPAQIEALKARLSPDHQSKVDDILSRPGHWSKSMVVVVGRARLWGNAPADRRGLIRVERGQARISDTMPEARGDAPGGPVQVSDTVPEPPGDAPEDPVQVSDAASEPGRDASEDPGFMQSLSDLLINHLLGQVIDLAHSPSDFAQSAIGNLPVAMFFLLPFFALALAVCHFFKRRFFVEHLVFGMHVHAFVFLTLAATFVLPDNRVGKWMMLILVLASPIYVLVAWRSFYREGWFRTLVKGFVVWNLYWAVLVPGLVLAALVMA